MSNTQTATPPPPPKKVSVTPWGGGGGCTAKNLGFGGDVQPGSPNPDSTRVFRPDL